jgi:hypothetical protein
VSAGAGVRRFAMLTVSALVAVVSLLTAAASLLVIGGAVFALILFFPLFLLALLGVMIGTGVEDRTVRQHNPSRNGTEWRNGS